MTRISAKVSKIIGRTIFDYALIEPDDRILVAVSGGKDSFVLAHDLAERKRRFPFHYDIEAVHVHTEFCGCRGRIKPVLESWGIKVRQVEVDVASRLKAGRRMNCYWCSTQRRTELLDLAVREGFDSIALGHHLDDVLETFFMNMALKGELSSMLPKMRYREYPVAIIRPLAQVEERLVADCVRELGIEGSSCACGLGLDSERKDMRKRIEAFTGGSSAMKRAMFEAMNHVVTDYLPRRARPGRPDD